MLNWDDLRHFLAIAREGSIGAAAKSLRVNQSTTQRRLQALEQATGVPVGRAACDGLPAHARRK